MKKWNYLLLKTGIAITALLIAFTGCIVPVDDDIDYSEIESVWQYLKVYSIYQWKDSTRVPEDPSEFTDAASLMAAVSDTLKSENYTHYILNATFPYDGNTNANIQKNSSGLTTVEAKFEHRPKAVRFTISEFKWGVTYPEFMSVSPMAAEVDTVIIDLCHNGGGDIEETDSIIEALLPAGVAYLQTREREYSEKDRTAQTLEWHTRTTNNSQFAEFRNKTFFVVMDGHSASASEMLIAALKEGVDAKLIGTTTYGKGIGQIRIIRRDRRKLQITFMQMRGLSERIGDYHRKGIDPDVASLSELLGMASTPAESSPFESASPVGRIPSPIAGYRTIYE